MGELDASPDNAEYVALFRDATEIILRDMPEIQLVIDGHINAMNTTYWTGWPTSQTADLRSERIWAEFYHAIIRLQPSGG